MKDRLKSPVVWLAVLAQICIVITLFAPSVSDTVKTVGACIVEILTVLGILNNPADCNNF